MHPISHAQALIDEWHHRLAAGASVRPSPTIAKRDDGAVRAPRRLLRGVPAHIDTVALDPPPPDAPIRRYHFE
jgi:hypothetical protein